MANTFNKKRAAEQEEGFVDDPMKLSKLDTKNSMSLMRFFTRNKQTVPDPTPNIKNQKSIGDFDSILFNSSNTPNEVITKQNSKFLEGCRKMYQLNDEICSGTISRTRKQQQKCIVDGIMKLWTLSANDEGHIDAQLYLARSYCGFSFHNFHHLIENDWNLGLLWYEKAAHNGSISAQFDLGLIYYEGIAVEINHHESYKWWKMAADRGDVQAQRYIGSLIIESFDESRSDESEHYFLLAARQGDAHSQYCLSISYDIKGDQSKQKMSAYWCECAAKQGHKEAQCNIGRKYSKGSGVNKDDINAMFWYEKSAEQGDAIAQSNLGMFHMLGTATAPNLSKAVKWFRLAAEQGEPKAQTNMGAFTLAGWGGLKQDFNEAKRWLLLAAKQGNAKAQKMLHDNNLITQVDNNAGDSVDKATNNNVY